MSGDHKSLSCRGLRTFNSQTITLLIWVILTLTVSMGRNPRLIFLGVKCPTSLAVYWRMNYSLWLVVSRSWRVTSLGRRRRDEIKGAAALRHIDNSSWAVWASAMGGTIKRVLRPSIASIITAAENWKCAALTLHGIGWSKFSAGAISGVGEGGGGGDKIPTDTSSSNFL